MHLKETFHHFSCVFKNRRKCLRNKRLHPLCWTKAELLSNITSGFLWITTLNILCVYESYSIREVALSCPIPTLQPLSICQHWNQSDKVVFLLLNNEAHNGTFMHWAHPVNLNKYFTVKQEMQFSPKWRIIDLGPPWGPLASSWGPSAKQGIVKLILFKRICFFSWNLLLIQFSYGKIFRLSKQKKFWNNWRKLKKGSDQIIWQKENHEI